MLDFLTKSKEDAIAILKDDHDKVKDLFEQFEKAEGLREKKKIAGEAIKELKIHAEIEEKIFYPTVRKSVENNIMNEADEEHHVAKLLIAELEQMKASDKHWQAKFTVLAENVRHHIREEEGDMLPQAREMDIDFEELGRQLLDMKKQLKKNGIPPCAEEKLIARNPRADSPARAAGRASANRTSTRKTPARILSQSAPKSAKKPAATKRTGRSTATRHARRAS